MPYENGYGRNFYGAINGGNMGGALARGMFAGAQGVPTDNGLPQYHGLNGFLDRFANPTTPLGNIGMAMLIGGGGPAGQAGEMLMANHRQKLLDAQATAASHAPDIRQVGDNLVQLGEDGTIKTLFNGAKPDAEHAALAQLGIDENSPQGQAYLKLASMRKLNPATTTLGVNENNAPIQRVSLASDIYGVNVNGQPPQAATGGQDGPQPPLGAGLGATGGVGPVPGRLAPQDAWNKFILPHEGGYSASDGNGKPVNFGINQGANPDINVAGLTPDSAEKVFQQRYWDKSGAGNLPAPLAAVHADTYYINPSKANQFLNQSNGDPSKYMDLRESWLNSLGQQPNYQRFSKAWTSRNADLRAFSAQQRQSNGGWSAAPDRATALQQAQQAIAAGVDPALVYSRLAAAGFAQ